MLRDSSVLFSSLLDNYCTITETLNLLVQVVKSQIHIMPVGHSFELLWHIYRRLSGNVLVTNNCRSITFRRGYVSTGGIWPGLNVAETAYRIHREFCSPETWQWKTWTAAFIMRVTLMLIRSINLFVSRVSPYYYCNKPCKKQENTAALSWMYNIIMLIL